MAPRRSTEVPWVADDAAREAHEARLAPMVGRRIVGVRYCELASDQPEDESGWPDVVVITLGGRSPDGSLWPSPHDVSVFFAAGAAVAGPLTEIVLVNLDAASYAGDSDDLGGVAPWLPCLYFAAGAVASGLWRAIEGAARDPDPRAALRGSAGRLG